MRRITTGLRIAAIVLLFQASEALATDFATVDRITFRCFTEQKWDSVILVGKQALKEDIDYFT